MIINNPESKRSNSRGLIIKSKEEQEEDKKNDNDNNNSSNNKATLIGTAHILREVFANVLWQFLCDIAPLKQNN